MTFLFPDLLWLLGAVPLLVGAYVVLLRRRKKLAMPFPHLAIIKQGLNGRAAIRRHVPPALLLLAISLLIMAMARPSAVVAWSSRGGTLIMAMDVSASMSSTDVSPDRITAAQIAARALIRDRAPQISVGVVKFSSTAFVVQTPTPDNTALNAAIDNLRPQDTTAIGDAVYVSLQMIFPGVDVDALKPGADTNEFVAIGGPAQPAPVQRKKPAPVQPGSYRSAAIILMTDGQNTIGSDPLEAARLAAKMGIRIYTIGFGAAAKQMRGLEGLDTSTILDETTLRQMAGMTKAQYFHAQSSDELAGIYNQLTTVVEKKPEPTEVTVLFIAAAAVFGVLSAAFSLLWYHRFF